MTTAQHECISTQCRDITGTRRVLVCSKTSSEGPSDRMSGHHTPSAVRVVRTSASSVPSKPITCVLSRLFSSEATLVDVGPSSRHALALLDEEASSSELTGLSSAKPLDVVQFRYVVTRDESFCSGCLRNFRPEP